MDKDLLQSQIEALEGLTRLDKDEDGGRGLSVGIIMVAWLVHSFNGGKKEMWGPHRHPPSIEKFFKLHHVKGDLGAAGDTESASQAGDDLERAGVLERRGQEEGAAERMPLGGGRVEPGHLHLSACLLARRQTQTQACGSGQLRTGSP